MLNIYLVRHGETAWNAAGNKYCGRTDLPLTEKGLQQAQAVQQQLKNVTLDAVYSSPLERAYHTAQIAGNGQNVIKDERLIEADFGQWEGKTREAFILENPALWDCWEKDPGATPAGGTGETAGQIIKRVDDFFNSLLLQYTGGNILVAAHNGVNRFYLAHKLGMPLKNYRQLVQHNATVTVFTLDNRGLLTLERLNCKL